MACPFLGGGSSLNFPPAVHNICEDDDNANRTSSTSIAAAAADAELPLLLANGVNKAAVLSDQISYSGYLQLEKLLDCQDLRSKEGKQTVPDEHLFIVIHQTYELWFKQIIFDIDQVRTLLHNKIVDETKTLQIVSLLERTAKILKLLVDQILILETMSPLDFVEFRRFLTSASGFQSLQFRLLENKLGVMPKNRVSYNYQHYREVFPDERDRLLVIQSEEEPSLFVLVDRWLSRTPGVYEEEFDVEADDANLIRRASAVNEDILELLQREEVVNRGTGEEKAMIMTTSDYAESPKEAASQQEKEAATAGKSSNSSSRTFWHRYLEAVALYLEDMRFQAECPSLSKEEQRLQWEEYMKIKRSFDTITDEQAYNAHVEKGERRLSHNALKGALMIFFYRQMPRFSQPYQILFYLMDIDSLLQKWRYNHLMLVQRMLGSKMGSGGSSGYMYLRSTVSDRYKVFLDFFNLSTWLIPKLYIPKLSPKMMKTLSGTHM